MAYLGHISHNFWTNDIVIAAVSCWKPLKKTIIYDEALSNFSDVVL